MSSPTPPPARSRRGCLSCLGRGCCGCLVALVALIVILAAAGWILRPGPEQRETITASPEASAAPLTGRGRVVLELEEGEFRIEPGPPGSSLSAEATADTTTSELEQEFTRNDDGSWTWHVRYGSRHGLVGMLFAGQRQEGQVVVRLPRDLPMDLELRLARGASEVELGGLDLSSVSGRVKMGEFRIGFSEPLAAPLESLSLETSFGNLRLDTIGNASPLLTHVVSSFGETGLGLGGAWRNPATVSVDFKMGALLLTAPPDLKLVRGDITVSQGSLDFPPILPPDVSVEGPPEIRLDVRGRFGEARLERLPE